MASAREQLFEILFTKSFIYREDPPFKLVSGRESFYYFDCKASLLIQPGLTLAGEAMFEALRDDLSRLKVDAAGGLTLGADPIALSTSIAAHRAGVPLLPVIVRKESKKHGTAKWIEGDVANMKNVIAIDDVITTGGSTILAIERMREAGLNVVKAAVLIDREEGGRENIEALGIEVFSLFKRSDFDAKRLGRG